MSKTKQVFIYIALTLVLCTLAFLLGMQVQDSRLSKQSSTANKQQEITTAEQETTSDQNDYYTQMDFEYAQQLSNAQSNVEVCEIHDHFSELWKDEIDNICDSIGAIASESLQQALFSEQQEWESAVTARFDCQLHFYYQVYRSGSIVPVLMAEYKCQLYRERAIDLKEMYDRLYAIAQGTMP